MDQSSGRDSKTNSGSDSAVHHGKGSAAEQFDRSTIAGSTPTVAPSGSTVRDQKPSTVPGSAVK